MNEQTMGAETKKTSEARVLPDVEAGLFARACRAYKRSAGNDAAEPSQGRSGLEGEFYVLANVRGELARFRYDVARDRLTLLS